MDLLLTVLQLVALILSIPVALIVVALVGAGVKKWRLRN